MHFFFANHHSRKSHRDSFFTQCNDACVSSCGVHSRAFRFLSGRWSTYVRRFYATRRSKSRFSKNPRHTANITSRYVNPGRSPARSLLRSANRRQYFKLRRRLNISIPDLRQSGKVRIKDTSLPAFLTETKYLSEGSPKQNLLSPIA